MKLSELKELLAEAERVIGNTDDTDVVFVTLGDNNKPRYYFFSIVDVYTEDDMIAFSMGEGPYVEIRKTLVESPLPTENQQCSVCGCAGWHSFSCTNKGY